MKLLILGATGPTGVELVRLAIKAGHEVTAVVRDPSKLAVTTDQLKVVMPDILDVDAMKFAIEKQDCVLSALGGGKNLHSTVISQAMAVLIPAMERAKVSRLIFLSSFGVGYTKRSAGMISRFFFLTLLRHVLADKEKADDLLRSSNLDYTLVYPTRLTMGPPTGRYWYGVDLKPGWWPKVSRADVAEFMLMAAERNAWSRQTIIITG